MVELNETNYLALSVLLREAIGTADYFNGSVELEIAIPEPETTQTPETATLRLTTTLIVYRHLETLPEGATRRRIIHVVPIWWELSSVTDEGAVPNDFSFGELKPFLIDND
ncbi:MAG: hypothetical protein LBV18_03115 [Alistipes sp.]|jgi:hypothetical protein|nr:hypothetical protein [Alistipes sp.]